jgi:hypothetical protein
MGTESHGSDYIWLAPPSRFLLRFLKIQSLKDSRAIESDVVKINIGKGEFSILVHQSRTKKVLGLFSLLRCSAILFVLLAASLGHLMKADQNTKEASNE